MIQAKNTPHLAGVKGALVPESLTEFEMRVVENIRDSYRCHTINAQRLDVKAKITDRDLLTKDNSNGTKVVLVPADRGEHHLNFFAIDLSRRLVALGISSVDELQEKWGEVTGLASDAQIRPRVEDHFSNLIERIAAVQVEQETAETAQTLRIAS